MADGVRIESGDFDRISDALREASDKQLTNNVRARFREASKPLGQTVLREGAALMPHRNGLAERVVSRGKVGISSALVTKTTRVTLLLRNEGVSMKALDAGIVRHPVFGNRRVWRAQSVRPHAFSDAFERQVPAAREAALKAAQDTLDGIARKV